jgi:hypothetical protein
VTLAVYAAAFPFSRTALVDDIVQRLPAASVIAPVEPARTMVSLGDALTAGTGSLPALHPDPVQLYHCDESLRIFDVLESVRLERPTHAATCRQGPQTLSARLQI